MILLILTDLRTLGVQQLINQFREGNSTMEIDQQLIAQKAMM